MNKARQRREQLQKRITENRTCADYEIVAPTTIQKVVLYIYGKQDDTIATGTVPVVGLAKKLDEMRRNGFWVMRTGGAIWVAPESVTRVTFYPAYESAEEPIELRAPPSKDSFKSSMTDFIGNFFGR